jgi:hypothetical protein
MNLNAVRQRRVFVQRYIETAKRKLEPGQIWQLSEQEQKNARYHLRSLEREMADLTEALEYVGAL